MYKSLEMKVFFPELANLLWRPNLIMTKPIFYFNFLLSVTVYMTSKSGLCWELDVRTYIVQLSEDKQHKCCFIF